jgi:hypothetical protein
VVLAKRTTVHDLTWDGVGVGVSDPSATVLSLAVLRHETLRVYCIESLGGVLEYMQEKRRPPVIQKD